MADEQTGDFFMPPAEDGSAFSAPAPSGEDSQIGDVYYGSASASAGEGDFFNPPAAPASDGDFFNPPAAPAADGDFFAPPAPSAEGDFFSPPAESVGSADGAPIILGEPAPYDPPAPEGVETVSDTEDEDEGFAASGNELVPAEPTPMAKWNEEWQNTLLRRKDDENATKASHVETARDEIAAFQAEREKRREARMAKNRSDEQDKLEAIEADLENDNSWQRVVKMIELNQDSSDVADTGRMKDVLVLLKNEPARADALSA